MDAEYRAGGLQDPEDEAGELASADEATPNAARADVDADGHGERLDRWLTGTGAGVLAQPPAVRSSSAAAWRWTARCFTQAGAQAARRPAGRDRTLQPTDESRAFRAEAMALDVVYRGRAPGRHQQARAGLVVHPAAGQLVGHADERAAGPPRRCGRRPAACRHRAPAGQGHQRADGRRQDAGGRHGAEPPVIAAREVHREYLALAWGRVSRSRSSSSKAMRPRPGVAREDGRRARPTSASPRALTCSRWAWARSRSTGRAGPSAPCTACCTLGPHAPDPRAPDAQRPPACWRMRCTAARPRSGLTRQALHAARLSFTHPGHWRGNWR